MNEAEIFEITRESIFTLLKVVTPIIGGSDSNSGNDLGFCAENYLRLSDADSPVSVYVRPNANLIGYTFQ